ncbi:MAG: hypothetical protein UY89_C0012G0004 [Parcubacteria group bacterium GW2011_GWA1_54_9]|nr:MAG: hypothetical protein UY89_C0012G0004 [Parcubacteria group bacterium GW2011_GWA1_54_9]
MDEAYGRLNLVHVLSTRPAAPRELNFNIGRTDFYCGLRAYGQDGDGGG